MRNAWRRCTCGIAPSTPSARPPPQTRGPLAWQITVRDDGQRLFDGCLPTLIAWGQVHPAAAMPESGVTLHRLSLRHPRAGLLRSALAAIGLEGVDVTEGSANVCATLHARGGPVRLESGGL